MSERAQYELVFYSGGGGGGGGNASDVYYASSVVYVTSTTITFPKIQTYCATTKPLNIYIPVPGILPSMDGIMVCVCFFMAGFLAAWRSEEQEGLEWLS